MQQAEEEGKHLCALKSRRKGYEQPYSELVATPNGFTKMMDIHVGDYVATAKGTYSKVLEEYEHAKKRGATIYAEIIGYGVSCDAFHMTAPDAEANGAAACFKMALNDAQISADDIDYINAHGTSTPLNDKLETLGVKKVFGEDTKVMLSSTKGNTGHLLGAAGAVEAIITVKSLQDGFVPGTINYSQPDPECDLDIVPNQGRKQDIQYAMSNSLGFGGHNACIVLKKYAG